MSQRPKTVRTKICLTASSSARLTVFATLWTGFSALILCSSILAEHLNDFSKHRDVFPRGDDEDTATRGRACNVRIRVAGGVGLGVQFQPQALQAGTDG